MKGKRNNLLTNARKDMRKTQGDIAMEIGLDRLSYVRIENLTRYPGIKTQNKIINYFEEKGKPLDKRVFLREKYNSRKDNLTQSDIALDIGSKNLLLYNSKLEAKLTSTQFAKELGITLSYYSDIENLRAFPTEKIQRKITNYLASRKVFALEEDLFPKKLYGVDNRDPERVYLEELSKKEFPFNENLFVEEMESRHRKSGIERSLSVLNEIDKEVFKDYTGINESGEELSLSEIGRKNNFSKQRAGEIKDRARISFGVRQRQLMKNQNESLLTPRERVFRNQKQKSLKPSELF